MELSSVSLEESAPPSDVPRGARSRTSISAERLAGLLQAIVNKEIDVTRAKDVFAVLLDSDKTAPQVMQEMGIEKVDESEIDNLAREVLEARSGDRG